VPPSLDALLLERCFDRLWPIPRSITGEGVRRTHAILAELLPLTTIEVPSGTPVFDWTIPKEWIVREAFVVGPDGRRVIDLRDNSLHLVSYSMPFRGRVSRSELDVHLHSRPDQPSAIPYVTSYYEPRWGFCLAHEQRQALPDGDYDVVIDTDLIDGSLTLSEAVLAGTATDEILISTYTCHPAMANNELSGPLVAALLYRKLAALPERRFTYRFVFQPETIGAIAYLDRMGVHLKSHLHAGLVLTCVGDRGPLTYKRSRQGDGALDRAASLLLRPGRLNGTCRDFQPWGSDEKHYGSPGFNLPVGAMMRTPPAEFPEYHSSLDNKSFVSFAAMVESAEAIVELLALLEANRRFINLYPYGEPQLGRRGLMATMNRDGSRTERLLAIKWVLNLSDGLHDLLAIAERSGIDPRRIVEAARDCQCAGLIAPHAHTDPETAAPTGS
jgi:aminopeptidase-like protein